MNAKKWKTIKWTFQLAWKIDKKMMLVWFFLSTIISVFPTLVLLYNEKILTLLNAILQNNNIQIGEIYKYAIILGGVMILQGLSNRINGDLVYMIMYDSYYLGMQECLMDHINKIELDDLLKKDINDQYNASFVRAGSLTNFLSSLIMFFNKVVSIIMLLLVALKTSLIIFAVSLIYTIVVIIFNSSFVEKLRFSNEEYQSVQRLAKFYEKMPMDIDVAKEVRIFGLEKYITDKWKKAFGKYKGYEMSKCVNMEVRNFISSVLFSIFVIIQVIYSIIQVGTGTLGAESCLIIYMLCANLYGHIVDIVRVYMETDYGIFALEKQYEFITSAPVREEKEEKCNNVTKQNVIFEAKDLEFHYPNGRTILKHMNFRIYEGEVIALVGENGCGKSTLTKLLLDMYHPTRGDLLFYGKDYKEYKKGVISDKIGSFFQDTYLFHTPVSENIAYSNLKEKNNSEKLARAIALGGAQKVIDNLPFGLNTIMGKDVEPEGVELSGGEKQLIAISRAMMSERDIMIYDEPAAKLDPIAEMIQFQNIKNNLEGRTAILISHRMGFARLADRIMVIRDGAIVENGSHEELMRKKDIYYNMFIQQAKWYDKIDDFYERS